MSGMKCLGLFWVMFFLDAIHRDHVDKHLALKKIKYKTHNPFGIMDPALKTLLDKIQEENTVFSCDWVHHPLDDTVWVVTLKYTRSRFYSFKSQTGNCKNMIKEECGRKILLLIGFAIISIAFYVDY